MDFEGILLFSMIYYILPERCQIIALHCFLCFVAFSEICSFVVTLKHCSSKHAHNLFRKVMCSFPPAFKWPCQCSIFYVLFLHYVSQKFHLSLPRFLLVSIFAKTLQFLSYLVFIFVFSTSFCITTFLLLQICPIRQAILHCISVLF